MEEGYVSWVKACQSIESKGKTMYYVLCLKRKNGKGILRFNRRETWGLFAFLLETHPLVQYQFIVFLYEAYKSSFMQC